MQDIKEIWESLKFSISRHSRIEGGETFFLLGDVGKINEYLLSHESILDDMSRSEYCEHFSKEIEHWKKSLLVINEITQKWITVQVG